LDEWRKAGKQLTETRDATAHKLVNKPVFMAKMIYQTQDLKKWVYKKSGGQTSLLITVSVLAKSASVSICLGRRLSHLPPGTCSALMQHQAKHTRDEHIPDRSKRIHRNAQLLSQARAVMSGYPIFNRTYFEGCKLNECCETDSVKSISKEEIKSSEFSRFNDICFQVDDF
jgi:hypothetical protein